jgi:hypothetical protein
MRERPGSVPEQISYVLTRERPRPGAVREATELSVRFLCSLWIVWIVQNKASLGNHEGALE